MTDDEYYTHFSLWALVKSPLLIGCDVTAMSSVTKQILLNTEVIAINQDPLGVQGRLLNNTNGLQVWGGPLLMGYAVVLLNGSNKTDTVTTYYPFDQLPYGFFYKYYFINFFFHSLFFFRY